MLEENSKKTQYLEYLDFSAYLNELNKNIDDKALNFMALGYLRLLKELNLVTIILFLYFLFFREVLM